MSWKVFFSDEALEDLRRLEDFLIEQALAHGDWSLPERAMAAIRHELRILRTNPFTCLICCLLAADNPYERELVIPFGGSGYVAFFGIVSEHEVIVAAIRHQREDDWR